MIKYARAAVLAVSLLGASAVLAEDKTAVDPSKAGPTETMTKQVPTMTPDATATAPAMKPNCTAIGIDEVNTSIKAMTDTAKQKMAMDHVAMAKKSMDAKDTAGCEMHMKEAMGTPATMTK